QERRRKKPFSCGVVGQEPAGFVEHARSRLACPLDQAEGHEPSKVSIVNVEQRGGRIRHGASRDAVASHDGIDFALREIFHQLAEPGFALLHGSPAQSAEASLTSAQSVFKASRLSLMICCAFNT